MKDYSIKTVSFYNLNDAHLFNNNFLRGRIGHHRENNKVFFVNGLLLILVSRITQF